MSKAVQYKNGNMTQEIQEVIVLTAEQYKRLEGQVTPPSVNSNTTDVQAGFMLGIQHVLKLLREGYVSGATSRRN